MVNSPDLRLIERQAVLKRAKLIFNGSVLDCLVTNMSETGFKVQLDGMVPVSPEVTVQFSGGTSFRAAQCWARGTEIGFQLTGPAQLSGTDRWQAWDIYDAVRGKALDEPLLKLRQLRFFDDPELGRLTEEAETALARLQTALRLLAKVKA